MTQQLSDSMPDELAKWNSLRNLVDAELDRQTAGWTTGCPARLKEAIRYSLLAPGKRLRPLLAMLGAEAIAGRPLDGLPPACAVEMIHCYSLIHDDLPSMDDDDLRRGLPTCHIRFDEATAILAGDALQAMAFEVLSSAKAAPEIIAKGCRLLAKAAGAEALVGGQVDDLMAEQSGGDLELLQAIHRRKTGAMILVSVKLGAVFAGSTPPQEEALDLYGRAVGQAFQIVDDLLDVESTQENVGKRTGKDHARGKLTYPALFGAAASRTKARHLIDEAIASLIPFADRGRSLARLAQYVLERSN